MAQVFRVRDLIEVMFDRDYRIDLDAVVLIDVDGSSRPVVSAWAFEDCLNDGTYEGSGLVLDMGPEGEHAGWYRGLTPTNRPRLTHRRTVAKAGS
jgi:hypothetical protein